MSPEERAAEDARPQHEVPYLHLRPPRRILGVGGEGDPDATLTGNRASLLRLRDQIDRALRADEGLATVAYGYREIDGKRFDVTVEVNSANNSAPYGCSGAWQNGL